jgi:general stress protein YciG
MSSGNNKGGFQNWDKDELREVARKGGEHSHGGGRKQEDSDRGDRSSSQEGGDNRGFASMDPQKQESIASKGGLTAQAHRHGFENVEDYERAKDRGEVEFSNKSKSSSDR